MHSARLTKIFVAVVVTLALGLAADRTAGWSQEPPAEPSPAELQVVPEVAGPLDRLALSPDGHRLVASGDDGWTRVWDVDSGRLHLWVPGHHALLSDDGSLLITATRSGAPSSRVLVWEVETGELIYEWQTPPVHSLALSPDGTAVAAGNHRSATRVWDLASGELRHDLRQGTSWIRQVAFGPEGERLVTSSSDGVYLWDLRSGRPIQRLGKDSRGVMAVAPDGSWLVTADTMGIGRVWDLHNGQMETILTAHEGTVEAVLVTPDGERAVTAGRDKLACIWNRESGRPTYAFTSHVGPLTALALSPDGTRALTGSADKTARLWSLKTGEVLEVLRAPGAIRDVAFSEDGSRLAVGDGTFVGVWETETGRPVRQIDSSWTEIESLAFSPDGGLLLALEEDKGHLWHLTGDRPPWTLEGAKVETSQDGTLAVAGLGCCLGRVRVWDVASQRMRAELAQRRPITAFTLSEDGEWIVTGSSGGEVLAWRTARLSETTEPQASFQGLRRAVTALTLSPPEDGGQRAVYAGYQEGSILAWDLAADPAADTATTAPVGSERFRIRHRRSGQIHRLVYLDDGPPTASDPKLLLSCQSNDPAVLLWDAETGEARGRLEASSRGQGSVHILRPGPQRWWLTVLASGALPGVWELAGNEDGAGDERGEPTDPPRSRTRFEGHEGEVLGLATDETLAVTGGNDRTVRLWSLPDGERRGVLKGLGGPVRAVAVRASGVGDGSGAVGSGAVGSGAVGSGIVAGASGGEIRLWSAETGVEVARLYLLTGGRWAVIAPDGRWDAARDGELPELPVRDTGAPPLTGASLTAYSLLSDHRERRQPGLLAELLHGL